MTTESREHLSCLMDGEISRETGRFLVRRLGADEELCATWARYHVLRDCLRHGGDRFAGEGLSSRVRRAIEGESLTGAPHRKRLSWLKPAAGLAVAASVALLAIVAWAYVVPTVSQPAASLNAMLGILQRGQGGGAVCWKSMGQPVAAAVSWERRNRPICRTCTESVGQPIAI